MPVPAPWQPATMMLGWPAAFVWLADDAGSVDSDSTFPSARCSSDTLSLEEAQRVELARLHGGSAGLKKFSSG